MYLSMNETIDALRMCLKMRADDAFMILVRSFLGSK